MCRPLEELQFCGDYIFLNLRLFWRLYLSVRFRTGSDPPKLRETRVLKRDTAFQEIEKSTIVSIPFIHSSINNKKQLNERLIST